MKDKAQMQRDKLATQGYVIRRGWFATESDLAKAPYGYDLYTTLIDTELKELGISKEKKVDHPEWYDHPWVLEKDGATIYAIEPYDFGQDSWGEMARLVDEGWQVEIMGSEYSVHNPGETIVIWISREEIG